MINFLITLSISTIRKNEQEIYFEIIESTNKQQISRPHPLPFCAGVINAWSLRSSIKFQAINMFYYHNNDAATEKRSKK